VTRRYSLAGLERLARRSAPGLGVARARLKAAEAQLLKAKLLWVPKARLQAFYSIVPKYRCVVPEAFREVQLSGGGTLYDELNQKGTRESFCLGTNASDTAKDWFNNFDIRNYYFRLEVTLGQPIYTFGKIRFAKRLARHGVALQRARIRKTRQQTVRDVRRAYYGLKLAREMLFTISEGEPHLRRAERRLDAQLEGPEGDDVDKVDLYRLRIARAEVDDLKLQVRKAERLALAALRALLGSAAGERFDIDKKPLAVSKATVKPLPHYLELARKNRPEWKMLDLAVRAAKTQVKLRTVQFLPDLVFLLKYKLKLSTSPDDPRHAYLNDQLHGNSLYLGLGLRWDLDFHFKYTHLARARADLLQARSLREQARLGIALQIERAWEDLRAAHRRMQILSRAQRAARRWMIAMKHRLDAGGATIKKMIDSVKAFFQAQLRHHQAVHDFNRAAAELSRAVGEDIGAPVQGPKRPFSRRSSPRDAAPRAR
jgi:outer membrane protein TolC